MRGHLPDLNLDQVLSWADAHFARTGEWPTCHGGPISEAPGETWLAVEAALFLGLRGWPGGDTLARLLKDQRDVRIRNRPPDLDEVQILSWADEHHRRSGSWPTADSGPIAEVPDETWTKIDAALRNGSRGLNEGSSLARLLAEYRDVLNQADRPRFKMEDILSWADAHRCRTGSWPTKKSGVIGAISLSHGDTWMAIDRALREGTRGLSGGSSLSQLLAARRGHRNVQQLPPLSIQQILAWADTHLETTDHWPTRMSGAVPDSGGEKWSAIDMALHAGVRHLQGGSSLARLLAEHRGVRNRKALPKLTAGMILTWADAYHSRTGAWPKSNSGPILEVPDETWMAVDMALRKGLRGCSGGSSLARLLRTVERQHSATSDETSQVT